MALSWSLLLSVVIACVCDDSATDSATSMTPATVTTCLDGDPSCAGWASIGECERNPGYMLVVCKLSCECDGVVLTPAPTLAPSSARDTPAPTPVVMTSDDTCTGFLPPLDGIDLAGVLIAELHDSAESCCSQCEDRVDCQGYSYVRAYGLCYLKANVTGTYANPVCTTHLRSSLGSGSCGAFDEHIDSDLAGDLIATQFAPSVEGCCGACDAAPQCHGFSYVQDVCYLKANVSGVFGPFVKDGAVTHIRRSLGEAGANRRLRANRRRVRPSVGKNQTNVR